METNLTALRNAKQNNAPATLQAGFNTIGGYDLLLKTAQLFANSDIVPKMYHGNVSNCAIALNMAYRLNADPMQVMQNLNIIMGRPAWSSKFLIATFNQCGRYTSIKYEFAGAPGTDDYRCRAVALEKETGEKVVGPTISIAIAKKEGWFGKNGSKWQTIPELMLRYRAASMLINTVAPELSMGIYTEEEARDITMSQNSDGTFTVEELKKETPTKSDDNVDNTNAKNTEQAPPANNSQANTATAPAPDGKVYKKDEAPVPVPGLVKKSKTDQEIKTWLEAEK